MLAEITQPFQTSLAKTLKQEKIREKTRERYSGKILHCILSYIRSVNTRRRGVANLWELTGQRCALGSAQEERVRFHRRIRRLHLVRLLEHLIGGGSFFLKDQDCGSCQVVLKGGGQHLICEGGECEDEE